MEPGWIAVVVAVIGSGGVGGLLASRSTRENALIDQYQERDKDNTAEIEKMKTQHAQDKAELREEFTKEIQSLRERMLTLARYNFQLIEHINEGKPPPPPAMPPELYNL